MLPIFDFAREMTLLAVTVRMLSAALCGGLVGIERELKRRPAGFRTHILICVGASMTILTNLYLYQVMHLDTDIARLGAQVIAGISFIGAGTIIVTRRQRVKGLTTAAGLWTVSIIGLVCGAGYLELAFFVTLMVLVAEILLVKLEYRFANKRRDVNLLVEYGRAETVEQILRQLRQLGGRVGGLEISRVSGKNGEAHYSAVLTLHGLGGERVEQLRGQIMNLDDVRQIEEL